MHTAQSMLAFTLEAESLKCAAMKHSAKTNNDRFLKKERERENSLRYNIYVWECFEANYNAFPYCLLLGKKFKRGYLSDSCKNCHIWSQIGTRKKRPKNHRLFWNFEFSMLSRCRFNTNFASILSIHFRWNKIQYQKPLSRILFQRKKSQIRIVRPNRIDSRYFVAYSGDAYNIHHCLFAALWIQDSRSKRTMEYIVRCSLYIGRIKIATEWAALLVGFAVWPKTQLILWKKISAIPNATLIQILELFDMFRFFSEWQIKLDVIDDEVRDEVRNIRSNCEM